MTTLKKTPLRIETSLFCNKEGCPCYGTPQTEGFCSKCYREHQQIKQRRFETQHMETTSMFPHFDKLKLKQSKLFSTILKNPDTTELLLEDFIKMCCHSDAAAPDIADIQKVKFQAKTLFIKTDPIVQEDVYKFVHTYIRKTIRDIVNRKATIDEISMKTQNFYQDFSNRMESNRIYSQLDSTLKEKLLDYVEKYSMTFLHQVLFCFQDDEKMDLEIQKKIRDLNWVNASHLDCPIDEMNPTIRDLALNAIIELINVDSIHAPQEKLSSIVKCCKNVFQLLQHSVGRPASADEFLPSLIFVVLKANPARLKSNINYITRFCNANRLMTGEDGYCFTNLCCAVSFIEGLTAESLEMSKEEFDQYMAGDIVGSNTWECALVICENVQEMNEYLLHLSDLNKRYDELLSEAENMKNEILKLPDSVKRNIDEAVQKYPFEPKRARKKIANKLFNEGNSYKVKCNREKMSLPNSSRNELLTNAIRSQDLISFEGNDNLVKEAAAIHSIKEVNKQNNDHIFRTKSDEINTTTEYKGFSSECLNIQSIPCEIGTTHAITSSRLKYVNK